LAGGATAYRVPVSTVTRRPLMVVAAVAVLWGTIGVIVREVDLPAVAVVAVRVWVGAAVLAAWIARRRRPLAGRGAPRSSHARAAVVAAGLVLAVHWVALVAALQRAPIGIVLLVTYLAPVGVAAAAPRALGERAPARTLVALGLALAGVALVAGPSLGTPDAAGLGLAAVAGVTLVVLTLVSKPLSQSYGGAGLAVRELGVAALALVPVALAADWGTPSPWSWAWLVVLGAVHTGLAVGAYLGALAALPVASVGVLLYLEPASALVFGWLLLSEVPGPTTLLGGALIVVAGTLVLTAAPASPVAVPPRDGIARVPG
jgi:drug/metabolite transporter, DME family